MFDYTIRDARPEDIENIIEIELESFLNPWRIENFVHEFKIPFAYILVTEHKDKIIGYADIWIVNDEIHLNKIAVSTPNRRRGIAGSLISYIITKYDNLGIRKILLEVREKNSEARKFYKDLGFMENGFRKNYYPDDNAILIEKNL
jgi:[ribosomal protein S18]-alanine N-acetyltransferase